MPRLHPPEAATPAQSWNWPHAARLADSPSADSASISSMSVVKCHSIPASHMEQSLWLPRHLQPAGGVVLGLWVGLGQPQVLAGVCCWLGRVLQNGNSRVHIAAILPGPARAGTHPVVGRGGPRRKGRLRLGAGNATFLPHFCGQSKSHGQSRFKGWEIVSVLSQRAWGERKAGGLGSFLQSVQRQPAVRREPGPCSFLLLLAVQTWAGAEPLVSASSSAKGD